MPASIPSTNHYSYSPRIVWCWVLSILFAFVLFRLPGLGVPFASDELAMVSIWSQMPYLKIFSNYQYPNNHIFLSLVLSFLLKTFGLKEWLLRMPLLICGMVSIFLSFHLGRRISKNSTVGIFTAFLMSICEKHIFYSTNARGYLVIMVLALLVMICLLSRLEGHTFKAQKLSDGLSRVLAFMGWTGIWIVGTWTVPTFLFFEVSVAIFLAGLLFAGNRLPQFKRAYLVIPLASCVAGGIGFYFQYYVLIDSAMLAEATSHAAKTSLPLFFPELLTEWMKPFDAAGILFFLLAIIGILFQQNRHTAFLLACIWLGPALMGIAGFLLEKLPGVPHPRTFFYLQPFFLMLGVMGAREVGIGFLSLVERNSSFNNKGSLAIPGVLAGVLFLISCANFYQHTYPQRLSREPLDRVYDFVKKLNWNDLILVSDALHVEFYLYGSGDMRQRIKNILHEGEMGNIYFLDYQKNSISLNQELEKKEKRFLNFPVLTRNAGKEGPTIPEKALVVAGQFGPYVFYRLKDGWLQPLQGWGNAGLSQTSLRYSSYRWEKFSGPSGIRPLIRFENSFTVAMESKKPLSHKASALTLNLMEVAGNEKSFSAVLVGGQMKEGSIILDPSWLANAWMLDHPYGSKIFNRLWNPAVFISQGAGNLSVIDVKFSGHPEKGAFRNFLSYRIDEPGVVKK
jgi:hypothetical protein